MRHRLLQLAAATSVFAIALLGPFLRISQADDTVPVPGQCAYIEHYPTGIGAEACTPWD